MAASPVQFTEHTVGEGLRGGYQVVVADLNHDGKPDLIALASGMPELVWYENPGWPAARDRGRLHADDQSGRGGERPRRRDSGYRAGERIRQCGGRGAWESD